MAGLTTHILDTARGCPAEGVQIVLFKLGADGERVQLKTLNTNADGRVDGPLLQGDDFKVGTYVLEFAVADYFRACGTELAEPPFLDVVPIQFGIADKEAHYHVPLLISPYGYSTYRGS
ncbi:MAG: hydroxyisourate hydrolase [Kordiimonadales bacterium]|nr:MAG: hydroxyisourate hydrolase [Kordiimonadales bacterium]